MTPTPTPAADPRDDEIARLRARVGELERSLRTAAQRATQAEQRAALAEASARTAWRCSWPVRPARSEDTNV